MTVTHALTPAPRRGDPAVFDPAVSDPAAADTTNVLRAARALADTYDAPPARCAGASAVAGAPACARASECERAGVITVVTEDATTPLCGMHAMTAVFTTPGLLALVKPADT